MTKSKPNHWFQRRWKRRPPRVFPLQYAIRCSWCGAWMKRATLASIDRHGGIIHDTCAERPDV
jgi:hypothetical protein